MRLDIPARLWPGLALTMLILAGCVSPEVGPTPTTVPAPATDTPVPPTPVVVVVTATPEPTPVVIVVTATPQPTPIPSPTPMCAVVADALNLRRGPDRVQPPVRDPLRLRTRLEPWARSPDGQWVKVRVQDSGEIGWVFARYISCNIDPFSLPLTEVPPTPTAPPTRTPTPTSVIGAWRGQYFDKRDPTTGQWVLERSDPGPDGLDFNWGSGAPDPALPSDNFSVSWTLTRPFDDGQYRFHALVDDGVRVYVDGNLVINEWRDGPPREVTGEHRLSTGSHSLRVDYYERFGDARIHVWWEKLPPPTPFFPDWKGEYWSNREFKGNPTLAVNNSSIAFHWGERAPEAGLPVDRFSVRWSREKYFDAGLYRFSARADDGIRFYLDGELVLNEWHDSSGEDVYQVDRALAAGKHQLVVEYYDNEGVALVEFRWDRVTETPTPTATATSQPGKRPDLVIAFAEVRMRGYTGGCVNEYSPLVTTVVVRNQGAGSAGPFVVRADILTWSVEGLAPGAERRLERENGVSGQVIVDANNQVVESDETNNTGFVAIPTPPPICTPTPVTPTPTQITPTPTPVTPTPTPVTPTPTVVTPTPTPVTPTPTVVTPTPTPVIPTPVPSIDLRINEILPAPAVDWNQDGTVDDGDEWIELYNAGSSAVDLGGWYLDDSMGGSRSYMIPGGVVLQPGEYRLFFRRETGIVLKDTGDMVRLISPDRVQRQEVPYPDLHDGGSLSRDDGNWRTDWPPSPGRPNAPRPPGEPAPG